MDNLTSQQYESVLHYMQKFHEQNFQQALKVMEQNNFSLSEVQERRNRGGVGRQGQQGRDGQHGRNGQNVYRELQESENQGYQEENGGGMVMDRSGVEVARMRRELVRRYSQAQARNRGNRYARYCRCFNKVGRKFMENYVPEIIKRKFIRSSFYCMYQDHAVIQLRNQTIRQAITRSKQDQNLSSLLQRQRANNPNPLNPLNPARQQLNTERLLYSRYGLKKNIFLIVSGRERSPYIVDLLRKKKLLSYVSQEFQIVGVVDAEVGGQMVGLYDRVVEGGVGYGVNNSRLLLQSQQPSILQPQTPQSHQHSQPHHQPPLHLTTPSIHLLRERRLIEDLQLVHSFYGEQQIQSLTEQKIKQVEQRIVHINNRESELIRLVMERFYQENMGEFGRSFMFGGRLFGNYRREGGRDRGMGVGMERGGGMEGVEGMEGNLDTEAAEQFIENRRQSKLIAQQNKQYKQMQRKKQQQQHNRQKKQQQLHQYLQQRQCRKLSLPEEPSESEPEHNTIKVIFRCPNGDSLTRRFHRNQKCEILFQWVELNDEIQFEGDQEGVGDGEGQGGRMEERGVGGGVGGSAGGSEGGSRKSSSERVVVSERKFDLLFSYPPESLRDRVNVELGEVFEGGQVKILIREQ